MTLPFRQRAPLCGLAMLVAVLWFCAAPVLAVDPPAGWRPLGGRQHDASASGLLQASQEFSSEGETANWTNQLKPVAAEVAAPGDEPQPTMYCEPACETERILQILPDGLLYRSYLAGPKEPRFAGVWLHKKGHGLLWENALGGRVGVLRHGTGGSVRPEGWQLDMEGAVFTRLDWEDHVDLDAADFRFGVPMTWRRGRTAVKLGYYHISSHLGDEFLQKNPGFNRRNYVRDAAIVGVMHDLNDDVAVYGEVAWAPAATGGAQPLEFQFGAEYSPLCRTGLCGAPFAAVNVHLREEFNFAGSANVVAGWQWRGADSGRRFRIGGQYYNGKSLQFSFFDQHEELLGFGIWLDY